MLRKTAHSRKQGNRLSRLVARIFCKRSIIIIADHKTEHYPISGKLQLLVIAGVLGFITWASFSTGSYMAAKSVLKAKDQKIANTKAESAKVNTEFALLKRDLSKMLNQDGEEIQDYAKFVAKQYDLGPDGQELIGPPMKPAIPQLASKGIDTGVVFQRIEYLEQRMAEMQDQHTQMITAIKDTTKGKIAEIEQVIAGTGLPKAALQKQAERDFEKKKQAERDAADKASKSDEAQGGPYIPVGDEVLQEQDEQLYNDLRQMMILNEVQDAIPLARPIRGGKLTSGFGVRMDPFNRRLSRHMGIDLSSAYGSAVVAANDGVVTDAGWKNAYGNMVEVDHGLGITTRYGHLSKIAVRPGQRVAQGQLVGNEGSTGRSTGTHLHYEVRFNNQPLNPMNFLRVGENVQKN